MLLFVATQIWLSTPSEILYVLPDNSTNAVSCPSQPCATLSQYVLDNGTLPVMSNAEYHFLPGEHHVPANMVLQNLYNFSMIGIVNKMMSPVVLIGCSQPYVIYIIYSQFVTISNVEFKHCDILPQNVTELTNIKLSCCFSCIMENVTLLKHGVKAINLIGRSYLNGIKFEIVQPSRMCCQVILLEYTACSSWSSYDNHTHIVIIDQLYNHGNVTYHRYTTDNAVVYLHLDYTMYIVNILLTNSYFCNMDRTALQIKNRCFPTAKSILVKNCTFKSISTFDPIVKVLMSHIKKNLKFIDCIFHSNKAMGIKISVELRQKFQCSRITNKKKLSLVSSISLIRCRFVDNNYKELLIIENKPHAIGKLNVVLESLDVLRNTAMKTRNMDMILITGMNVHIKGPINVFRNYARLSIIQFKLCNILCSGKILFDSNHCNEAISLDSHIKVAEHTNITIISNRYRNNIITVTSVEKYYQVHPFCLFQYIGINNNTRIEDLLSHYTIIISENYNINNAPRLPLQNDHNCSVTFCHFMSHCKWISSSAFNNYNPEVINRQIIQYDDSSCYYHKHICYCSESKEINCSVDMLGMVYPGQTLRTNLCNMCSNYGSNILYAEVHSIDLPSSSCNIVRQSQLVSIGGNDSNTVNYTIVSNMPDNNRCELFLTATPFLNKIYDAFYVELLPCPVGFTLQDGICNCDPILSDIIVNCYIDYSAVTRPANTWITDSQTNNTKYLISECPMDYCLPYSSNVNLLYPDLQCQFNRSGILCSQCHHDLSMVFGSSRCIKCTNVHILITIIIIVAGIILVASIYFLNLTVTNGTINGIIFYANVVSINDSIFLVNDTVFKPLRVFISFANLDLGIETCFYNGMDSYAKMWLQLFFPFYLIIIAASIIIASRYSYKILRLTYTRSLPVLATLFLLSYTGVLRTVLTVLFSYSTITHLPSGHQQIVWSIDANIPLFGVKFTVLFITCLVLFLLLIPFNIILLFTRYLLQFRIINRFKPLLDAFQGSYKDKYYYWIAVNIILRSLFFALYGFQTKPRLIITTMILVLFTGSHGYIHPNKSKLVNVQELLLLINLTIMYAVSYQCSDSVFSIVKNLMIGLVCIQLFIILLYHFFTYTCHCNIVMALHNGKQKLMQLCSKKQLQNESSDVILRIPEPTYNYEEYQDGLVTEDFK